MLQIRFRYFLLSCLFGEIKLPRGSCSLPPPVGGVWYDGEGGHHLLLTQGVLRHTGVFALVIHLDILNRSSLTSTWEWFIKKCYISQLQRSWSPRYSCTTCILTVFWGVLAPGTLCLWTKCWLPRPCGPPRLMCWPPEQRTGSRGVSCTIVPSVLYPEGTPWLCTFIGI